MRGRKPALDNVVPMKGTVEKHVPEAPDWMPKIAQEVWEELAPSLVAKGKLDPDYTRNFEAYCVSVANFVETTICIELEGRYYETQTRNGTQQKKTASWGQQQEAMAAMRQFGAGYGLTPVDDARLKGGGQGDLFAMLKEQLDGGD